MSTPSSRGEAEEALGVLGQARAAVRAAAADAVVGVVGGLGRPGDGVGHVAASRPSSWPTCHISFQKLIFVALNRLWAHLTSSAAFGSPKLRSSPPKGAVIGSRSTVRAAARADHGHPRVQEVLDARVAARRNSGLEASPKPSLTRPARGLLEQRAGRSRRRYRAAPWSARPRCGGRRLAQRLAHRSGAGLVGGEVLAVAVVGVGRVRMMIVGPIRARPCRRPRTPHCAVRPPGPV